jgi:hypothetical protein
MNLDLFSKQVFSYIVFTKASKVLELRYVSPNMVEIEKSRQKTESFRFEIDSISIRADSGWNQ